MAVRILHVVTYMGRGGLETMIMNYYRHINRKDVQFDFLVHREFEADYEKEILELGGRIYRLSRLNPFDRKYLRQLDNFFAEHKEYSIVHSHLDCMAGIPLKYAKKNGVPVCIAHAHNNNQIKDSKYLLKLLYKRKIVRYADYLFACSNEAGKWMFANEQFSVMNNAIDSEQFIYNEVRRDEMRNALGIDSDTLVIGHVGRFMQQKNHRYIIKVFEEVVKKVADSKLLLVGNGVLIDEIKKLVSEKGLESNVLFMGERSDVYDLLQAMDVFLFPSLFEGLGIVAIEAQAAGLPCLISTGVPLECKKTDLVWQLALDDSPSKWADMLINISKKERGNTSKNIKEAEFDICENAKKIEKFYLECVKNGG